MKRLLLLIIFGIFSTLHACALCQLYTPKVGVYVRFNGGEDSIDGVHITWQFSEIFSRELMARYGSKQTLDEEDLAYIKELLLEYLRPREYLTSISHASGDNEVRGLYIAAENPHLFLRDSHVQFSYYLPLDIAITSLDTISVTLEDGEGFFDFVMMDVDFAWRESIGWSENLFNNVAFISKISAENMENRASLGFDQNSTTGEKLTEFSALDATSGNAMHDSLMREKVLNEPTKIALSWNLAQLLEAFQLRLRELLQRAQGNAWGAEMLSLLGFSLLYGALHAAGPGHGKMLVGSYFFGTRQNRAKAVGIALAIGVVHTFSAFLMTLGIYYFFEIFFKEFLDNFVFYATKLSALIILSIAIYLLYCKLPFLRRFSFKSNGEQLHEHTCNCKACRSDERSDVGVVLGASIVPCPGTVTVFIFSIALGEYFIGFLSALCMSLGMSGVIFIAASLGLGLKSGVARYASRFVFLGEILGLCVMFLLGALLLAY